MLILIYLFILFLLQHIRFVALTNILQNQFYSFQRFLLYQKNQKRNIVFKTIYLLIVTCLCFINTFYCLFLPLVFIEIIQNKIKKFQWTNRVKRQFIVFEFLNIAIFLFLLVNHENIQFIFLPFLYSFAIYWLSFVISIFIEKIIQRKYLKLAKEKLIKYNVKFIAITGSYGKTSCKNYIYELLKDKYNVLQTPKSFNTLNGIIMTINSQLKPYHDIFIAEIGVDKKNGMNKYIKNFNIDYGIVTKIGNQHIKTFKTIENIKNEKVKILNAATKCAFINFDDNLIDETNIKCNKCYFSTKDENADICVTLNKQEIDKTNLKIKIKNNFYNSYTTLLGKHNLENLACAISVAKKLNVDDDIIISKIKKLHNSTHRLSTVIKNRWTILDDSYNSNFVGFLNALDVLKQSTNLRVIITPGLIEQIKNEQQDEIIANKIKECCDLIILINNPSFQNKIANKLVFSSFLEAYNYLTINYGDKDITLLIENDLPDIFLK